MKKPTIKIPHVAWRDGRPRFEPSATLRAAGYKGEDLRTADGSWMNAQQALEWSAEFVRTLQRQRTAGKAKPKRSSALATPVARPAFPLSMLFDEWTNPVRNPGWTDLTPKTQAEYRYKGRVIERYLPDVWHSEAAALTKPICMGMYDELRRRAGLSQASATMRALGTALQWAMDRGRLPDTLVNPSQRLGMTTPPPRLRVGSKREIEQLVAVADALGRPEIGDMITLGVWTGQRQGDRLNFTFIGRRDGDLVFRQMKTKVIVRIPESPEVTRRLDMMAERRKRAEVVSPNIILDEKRWKPMTRFYYHHVFAEIRLAAAKGLPATATRPAIEAMPSLLGKAETIDELEDTPLSLRDQDLRDTAVTWLANAGCTIPQICSITGHSFVSANSIMKHYLALNPDLARGAIANLVTWYDAE